MKITCPSCSSSLKVTERHYGKRVKCPGCREVIEVPEPVEELENFLEDDEDAAPRTRSTVAKRTRTCPMCGAKNSVARSECDHCGEPLRGSDGEHPSHRLWRDGKILIMHKKAKLPDRCIKTNGPADRWLRRKLYWHHPLIFLTLLGGLLIYVILALVLRKSADIKVGLCHDAYRRRIYAIVLGWLLGLGMFVGSFAVLGLSRPGQVGAEIWLMPLGLILTVVIAVISTRIASVVSPTKITDQYVWLKGVHPDYLAEFPDWPGEE